MDWDIYDLYSSNCSGIKQKFADNTYNQLARKVVPAQQVIQAGWRIAMDFLNTPFVWQARNPLFCAMARG